MKSSGKDTFAERAKALENSYFADKDKQLLDTMKRKFTTQEAEQLLIAATGLQDLIIIKELADLTEPSFLAVLAIFPVVEVAWADGEIQDEERAAILSAAHDIGINVDSSSYKVLNDWLQIPPQREAVELWTNYVQAICKTLEPATVAILEERIIGRARDIALAAGGFLGFGNKISEREQECLDGLAKAFKLT